MYKIEENNWHFNHILEDEKSASSTHTKELKTDGYGKQPWYDQAVSSVSWGKGNYGDSQQNHQHNWFHQCLIQSTQALGRFRNILPSFHYRKDIAFVWNCWTHGGSLGFTLRTWKKKVFKISQSWLLRAFTTKWGSIHFFKLRSNKQGVQREGLYHQHPLAFPCITVVFEKDWYWAWQ